jgi:hypothetical protein
MGHGKIDARRKGLAAPPVDFIAGGHYNSQAIFRDELE